MLVFAPTPSLLIYWPARQQEAQAWTLRQCFQHRLSSCIVPAITEIRKWILLHNSPLIFRLRFLQIVRISVKGSSSESCTAFSCHVYSFFNLKKFLSFLDFCDFQHFGRLKANFFVVTSLNLFCFYFFKFRLSSVSATGLPLKWDCFFRLHPLRWHKILIYPVTGKRLLSSVKAEFSRLFRHKAFFSIY